MQAGFAPRKTLRGGVALLAGLTLVGISSIAGAQTPPNLEQVDSVPPPPPVRSGEPFEPDVTIVRDQRGTVREYRVAGKLVAVKVTPKDAPAYYLVDSDGDGDLDSRRPELGDDFLVNSWLLFTWK